MKKLVIYLVLALMLLSCKTRVKAYKNYYLGEKIENDSIFKAAYSEDGIDGLHVYFRRIESFPNGSSAILTFTTTDKVLTEMELHFGTPNWFYKDAFSQIEKFKSNCTIQNKDYFLSRLRDKYGKESNSTIFHLDNTTSSTTTYNWSMKDHDISLSFRVEGMANPADMLKYFPEEYNKWDQAEHNDLWIKYSLNEEETKKLENRMRIKKEADSNTL